MLIPDDCIHPDWKKDLNQHDQGNENVAIAFRTTDNWTVQLEFNKKGQVFTGSGFFVNLPILSPKKLILTAAHNLVNEDKDRMENLEIYSPLTKTKLTIVGLPWWCPQYLTGSEPDKMSDYGAILVEVPSPYSQQALGFGFSLLLASFTTFEGAVHVTGFRNAEAPNPDVGPLPDTSEGQFLRFNGPNNEQVEYSAKTEAGISGSVVWIMFQEKPAVVAIHNHAPDIKNARSRRKVGSRGCRLTMKLICEVFDWVQSLEPNTSLIKRGVQIRLFKNKPPSRGLFLRFSDDFGRVRLGSGTLFDVLPAGVESGGKIVKYALSTDGKWVLFDIQHSETRLVKELMNGCLFTMASSEKAFTISIQEGKTTYRLLMQGDEIDEELDGPDAESSEVYLVKLSDRRGSSKLVYT